MSRFLALALVLLISSPGITVRADDKDRAAKPSYTDSSNGGRTEVKYVLDKVTRDGRDVTFALTATLQKGGDQKFNYFKMHAVDSNGKAHNDIPINYVRPGIYGLKDVFLADGVETRLEFRVKLPEEVTELKTVDFTSAAVNRRAIKFKKVEIPK